MDIKKLLVGFTIFRDVRTMLIVVLSSIVIFQAYQNQELRNRSSSMAGRTAPKKGMKLVSMSLTDLQSSKDVNLDFPASSVALYFFLRKECQPCKASKPLVSVLSRQARRRRIDPIVIYMDKTVSRDEMASLLVSDASVFKIRSEIAEFMDQTKAYATPSVYLVDTSGTVRSVWIGGIDSSKSAMIDLAMDKLVKGSSL